MTNPKEIPLLACAEMVRALRASRKRMTRRMNGLDNINADPAYWFQVEQCRDEDVYCFTGGDVRDKSRWFESYVKCPYHVGDVIWWRETWRHYGNRYHAGQSFALVEYRADGECRDCLCENPPRRGGSDDPEWRKWRPSIFMPKWACRMRSRIVEIHQPQRLQQISEEDAKAEGVEQFAEGGFRVYGGHGAVETAILSFGLLWDSLHGPGAWSRNEWVWPIEFEEVAAQGGKS